jgi:hypothetical protein
VEDKKEKWYFKSWTLAVSFFLAGPLMLPLVWANPAFSLKKKALITTLVLVVTLLLLVLFLRSLGYLKDYYQFMQNEIY